MKAVLQRVTHAQVQVADKTVGSVGKGLLVLLGVAQGDTESDINWMVDKVALLRIFEDPNGKMNLSVKDIDGSVLVVSQFTLLADCSTGRQPSFSGAMNPTEASGMVDQFIARMGQHGLNVAKGVFGAMMEVSLNNSGPVTIVLDSTAMRSPR